MRTWRGCCLPSAGSGTTSATGRSRAGGSRSCCPTREALAADVRLAILISLYPVARASEEFSPMDRFIDEMKGLLEVCSDEILHAAAWYFEAVIFSGSCRFRRALERSIACARAAREAPGLGPEFGLLTDRDFVLGTTLRAYADSPDRARRVCAGRASPRGELQIFQARGSRWEMAD